MVVASSALRVVALVVGVLTSITVARLGGPEIKGVQSVFAASLTVSFLFLNFDLPQQIMRETRRSGHVRFTLTWLSRSWALFAALGLGVVLVSLSLDRNSLAVLSVGAFVNLVSTQAGIVATGVKGPTSAALGAVVQQFAMLIGAVVLAHFDWLNIDSVKLLVAASLVAPLPIYTWRVPLRIMGNSMPEVSLTRSALSGISWQVPRALQTLLLKADLVAVSAVLGSENAGFYSVAIATAMLTNIVPQQMSNATLFRVLRSGTERIGRSALFAVLLGVACAIPLGVAAPLLVPVLYGNEFSDAIVPMLLALPGACAYGAVQVQSNYIRILGSRIHLIVANLPAVLTLAIALALTLERFGIAGAAVSFSCAMVVGALIGSLICHRVSRILAGASR